MFGLFKKMRYCNSVGNVLKPWKPVLTIGIFQRQILEIWHFRNVVGLEVLGFFVVVGILEF
jgi:hypothetical protein